MPLLGQDLYYVRCRNTGQKDCVPPELTVSIVQRARGADGGASPRKHRGDTGQCYNQLFECTLALIFPERGLDGGQQGAVQEVSGWSPQACVAAFPVPHWRGPVSQGPSWPAAPTMCANIPPMMGNMLSY